MLRLSFGRFFPLIIRKIMRKPVLSSRKKRKIFKGSTLEVTSMYLYFAGRNFHEFVFLNFCKISRNVISIPFSWGTYHFSKKESCLSNKQALIIPFTYIVNYHSFSFIHILLYSILLLDLQKFLSLKVV